MRRSIPLASILCIALLASVPLSARADDAASPDPQAVSKPIDTLIKAIRYKKYALAGKSLDYEGMSRSILRDVWAKMAEKDRAEFVAGYGFLMENLSFPKAQEKFEYLDDVSYEPARQDGDKARVRSVIVINHPTNGVEEIVVEYVMVPSGDGWRILDVILEGESTLDGIREDQIEDLLDDGGIPRVMKALRDKVAEVKKDLAEKEKEAGR